MTIRGARKQDRWARPGMPAAFPATALLVVLLLLGAACGSGALESPTSRSDSSARESTDRNGSEDPGDADSDPEGGPAPVTYGYSLPEGDTSHADENGVMYAFLSAGRCADAQVHLDLSWAWGFQSPEEVLMFQVATSMCAGDESTAAAQFDRGENRYGWAGIAGFGRNLCNIYRAYRSVRDQVPQDAISCPGGALVYWPGWPDPEPRDDPRTDAVEAASPYPEVPVTPEPVPDGTEDSPSEPVPTLPGEPTTTPPTQTTEPPGEPTTTPPPDQPS